MELHVGKHSGIQHNPCQSAYGRRFFNHFVEQEPVGKQHGCRKRTDGRPMVVLAVDFGFLPTCGIGLRTDTENVFCFPPQLFIQEQVLIQLLHPLGRCLTILRRTQMGCFPGRRHSLENFRRGFYGKDTKLAGQPETESQLRHHRQLWRNRRLQHHYPSLRIFCQRSLRQWKNRSFHTILGDLRQCRPRLGKIVQLEHRSGLRHTEQPHRRFH